VEVIRTEPSRKLVITDQNVYVLPVAANVTVTVGDELYAGDVLCDAIDLIEVSGSNPDYSVLPQITIGKELMSGSYLSGLTFKNADTPLIYDGLDADGKAVVKFAIYGYPADIDAYWDSSLALGKLAGNKTLAELLDTRTVPVGQPVASDLPAIVNPLEFIFQSIGTGNNLFIIKARQAAFADDAPGFTYMKLLREVMPPHVSYVVYVELGNDVDYTDLQSVTDDADVFTAAVVTDSLDGLSDVNVYVKHVSVNCV